MKGKIGLVTIYSVPNFGSVLQTYATQEVIRKLGYDCVVLQYKYSNEWHYTKGHARPSLKYRVGLFLGLRSIHRKENKLKSFRKNFFNFSRPYANLDALKAEDWSEYCAVVVGSDQVWNARFTLGDSVFMLSFLPKGVYRISIASSFASKSLPIDLRDKYRKYLSCFDAISVREKNGIEIIKQELLLACDPAIVLDPTLLLSREDWLSLIPRSKLVKKKKYIVLYMLTYAFNPCPYIFDVLRYMSEKYDYDILALEGYTPSELSNGIVMQDKTDSSILDFIDLFANADMVITSSFHGTAFAVNFGVPLISIIPNGGSDDRQSSLLQQIGLENCIVPIGTELTGINPHYNIDSVEQKLSELRNISLSWIKEKIKSH